MPDPSRRRTDAAFIEVAAPPEALYASVADPASLMQWLPPGTMTGRVLEYDFRPGGRYRIELTYPDGTPSSAGKTTGRTDVTTGRFLALEPGRRIVQSVEFESIDPAFAGEMRLTWSFEPTTAGTKVTITAEQVPPGISEADHAVGLRSSLENLAKYASRRGETTSTPADPVLKALAALVGVWTTQATHPAMPGVVVHGTVHSEWLEGERFLIQRARTDHPDFPDSISIIGSTDRDRVASAASGRPPAARALQLTMHYYDSRGVFRDYDVRIDDEALHIWRAAPGFSQRFTGKFSDGGAAILGLWQMSEDDRLWRDDLQIDYRRSE